MERTQVEQRETSQSQRLWGAPSLRYIYVSSRVCVHKAVCQNIACLDGSATSMSVKSHSHDPGTALDIIAKMR